ncbi:phenylalanine--tRNA ligase alpha subunit-like [Ylistrum balloti]|uniref:phenylalanine--tRNA ligase alpha subunit-like n=1 Tax=Ylistrum balloti TaxID=509963 RepID=UPI002905A206|nr:phenylalanine--tRNA ligase alpha subunit-like [Ylistrum balloti]
MAEELTLQAEHAASEAESLDDLRQVRSRFLGKKGVLSQRLKELGSLEPEQRKIQGQLVHQQKKAIEQIFISREDELKLSLYQKRLDQERIDVTLKGRYIAPGALHPLETTVRIVLGVLQRMGFEVEEGPEVEDAFHNFDALNFPPDHPAKEMQDTFFLAEPFKDKFGAPSLLRTHTSPVQIRAMEDRDPPLKIVAPGKVYRCDADVTHSPMFHQIEGFWVDKHVTFRDLKGILTELIKGVFGESIPVRFRPSFFPFTEPSAEVDMGWQNGWLEVLGCGMIHPNVLRAVDIDPNVYQGFAFGLGVERFAMLRYGIPDIRLFYESDVRFLRQLQDPLIR